MSSASSFSELFRALTGFEPMPWQEALYERFTAEGDRNIPASCNLPTGLGKTLVIAIWLIALATHPRRMPRRLVYVVNRRTVVDQTTDEVEKLRARLTNPDQDIENAATLHFIKEELSKLCCNPSDVPLAISTLRGQFADNREWSADPSRPAIICGTVDMIGSRLLFSGYGVGFKAKPLHAGFLGQDVLLVHDEAHLEPAFQELIKAIQIEQDRCKEFRKFHVMELTATTRSGGEVFPNAEEWKDNESHPEVRRRITAKKKLTLHQVGDGKDAVPEKIADLAKQHKESGAAVLIFVRTLEDVKKVCDRLISKKDGVPADRVQQLTGTMRGLERDALAERDPVFMRFLPEKNRNPKVEPTQGAVYLVCTSAGEVGIDISADHMVCDLSTFESMAQRFGRVNRYGDGDARIDMVCPLKLDEKDKLTLARLATLDLLAALDGDASPKAVGALLASLTQEQREAAFAPDPIILPATDILFDAWALTSIRERMPGRPPVEPYLHGISEWQPPETFVAWREEVEIIAGDLLGQYSPTDLLDEYPLKPQEVLQDRSDRVFKHLETLAKRHGEKPAWLMDDRGEVDPMTLGDLVDKKRKDRINGCTVLLPPSIDGLANGLFDGTSELADDVSDIPLPHPDARIRIWSNDPKRASKTAGMRRVKTIVVDTDEEEESRRWEWFERFPEEGGRTSQKSVRWDTHVSDVVIHAKQIIGDLPLPQEIANAIILAAELHDHGKQREQFQVTLGNRKYPELLLAKSGRGGARLPEPFRHEFASVLDAQVNTQFSSLNKKIQDLVLHLIAAHHGRARPHFDLDEAFDPERSAADAESLAIETPRRFARLQRKYGRWGLAYLESILRAADWAASANPSSYCDEETGGEA